MDEFLKALALIEDIVPETIEYRLHCNSSGNIVQCTMQQHPDSTQYVVVDKAEYDTYFHYHIKDGVLVKINTDTNYSTQLCKAQSGYKVVAKHASIILDTHEEHTHIEYYDRKTNN